MMSHRHKASEHTHIRPIQAADLSALKMFLSELSPGTLYFRFGRLSMPMWSEEQWRGLCEPNPAHGAHFVATQVNTPGAYDVIGIARLVFEPTANSAEFSLVVADNIKRQGLGRRLMHSLMGEASRRGLDTIYGDVLPSNTTMLSFCEGLGFAAHQCPDDSRIYRMVLSINPKKVVDAVKYMSGIHSSQNRLQAR